MWEYRRKGWNYDIVTHPNKFTQPLMEAIPTNYTVSFGSDLFHEGVPNEFIQQAFAVMNECNHHKFEISTKRIERALILSDDLEWTENIIFGTTVEEDSKKWRIEVLRKIPAHTLYLSFIPLLGPVYDMILTGIHCAGVSAEAWGHIRPCDDKWIEDIERQCENQGVKMTAGSLLYDY